MQKTPNRHIRLTAWGHPGELKRKAGGWFMLTPDGGYTEYTNDGYPTVIRDRYRRDEDSGSEVRLLWHAEGTLAQMVQKNGKRTTDLNPRTLTFRYGEEDPVLGDGLSPKSVVTSAEDSAGRTYLYTYDAAGRMLKAGIKGVELDANETATTGNVIETYAPNTSEVGAPNPTTLEQGAQIATIHDANEDVLDRSVLLDTTWEDGRVTNVTRGEDGPDDPAIVTSIVKDTEEEWTITEGNNDPEGHPTKTQIGLAELADNGGWTSTVTVGEGDDETTTTTTLDRDGRVDTVTAPGGITTVAEPYDVGGRRFSFLPKTVTTNAGSVGEPASTDQLITRYDYENGQVKRIERPGPVAPVVTEIRRSNQGRTIVTVAPDLSETTRHLDELGRVWNQISSTGAETILYYDDITNGSGELRQSVAISAGGTSTTTIGRTAVGHAESSRTAQEPDEGEAPVDRSTTTKSNDLGWTLKTESSTSVTETSYDVKGRITSIVSRATDGQGAPTETVPDYTSAGMISGITRSQGGTTETNTMTYDDAGRLSTSTTADVTTTYAYDSAGRTDTRAESWTEEDGAKATIELTTQYDYESVTGRLETTTTPGGKVWTNHYDTLGRQVGRSGPAGVRELLVLGADGRLAERKLTTGPVEAPTIWSWEEFGYDGIGRQEIHTVHRFPVTPEPYPTQEQQLTTTTGYYEEPGPKLGLVKWIEDSLKRKTHFDYDDAGREVERELPDGSKIETTYYPDGKVDTRTVRFDGEEPWSLTTTTIYDDQGRVHQVIDPGGRTTTTLYDELGRKKSVQAPDSAPVDGGEGPVDRLTTWEYGDLGRVVTETRSDGAAITRTYDERGSLVDYEDHEGNATTYHYFKNGRLKAIEYPDGSKRSFTYYDDGEMKTITRADDTVVTFEIDPATGRLDTVTATGDQPGGEVNFDYDDAGHLTAAYDDDATLSFTWDSVGNQLSESLALPGLGFNERMINRAFDDANRPATLTMPDGLPDLVRGYDDGNRLVGLTVDNQLLWSASYDGGRLTGIERANGLATTFSYDAEGRPSEVRTGVPGADDLIAAPIHRLAFGWTEASLRRSKTREDTRRQIERFHYDGAGHLESDLDEKIPAVAGINHDLATSLPGLDPRQVEEWWTVNLVDELAARRRVEGGGEVDYEPVHDTGGLHQVEESGAFEYDWDLNGNLEVRHLMQGETIIGTDTFSHDWRDRLVGADQGPSTTDLIVDPLGRLVSKERTSVDGTVRRIYLHDGDQVVAEYVQEAGGTAWQLERRHHWGRWIDDLAVEEVDTDADGVLDNTLYPVTDLLGSVQLLTDATGEIVERVEYQTDGTPRFFSGDATPPTAVRVAWTGNGNRPTGDTVAANVLEVGFDEWIEEGSVETATATLTPDGGTATDLAITLDGDLRGVTLTGVTIEAGTSYTLHVVGLADRAGNGMWALDLAFTVGDALTYETLLDTTPPAVLAVLDAADGLFVLFDEPVVPLNGVSNAEIITVERSAGPVAGSTERLGPQLFKWTPDEGAPWYPEQGYEITQLQVEDLATTPNTMTTLPGGFTHIATFPDQVLVAYSKPDHSVPLAQSQFGVTSLFQGRAWHEELGLYYYRARWYGPSISSFLARDPFGYVDSSSPYAFLSLDTGNSIDPSGLYKLPGKYNWFTGIQAHIFFSQWVSSTRWFETRSARGSVFTNKAVSTIVRGVFGHSPAITDYVGEGRAITSIARPDLTFVPDGADGIGEIYELKPASFLDRKFSIAAADTQLIAYIALLRLNGITVASHDFGEAVPETLGGVLLKNALVVDVGMDLYQVRIESQPIGLHRGLVFYRLLGGTKEELESLRQHELGWAKVLAPKLEALEKAGVVAERAYIGLLVGSGGLAMMYLSLSALPALATAGAVGTFLGGCSGSSSQPYCSEEFTFGPTEKED